MPSFRRLTRRLPLAGPALLALVLALGLSLVAPAVPARAVELTSTWDAKDFIILYSAGYYRHWFPGAGLFYFDDADFTRMQPGEPVWIVAHGDIGQTGRKNAGELLTLFTARRLPPATPYVYLFSCLSGSTDATHPQSLVEQLGRAMRGAQWNNVTVVGSIGCSVTDALVQRPNSERVIRPATLDRFVELQDRLERELNPQGDIDRYLREFEHQNGRPATLEERTQYAYLYSQPTRTFFAELLRQADQANLLYPVGQSLRTYP